ncbi:ATP-binding protein [Methylobacterium sp. 391_Methyba4]|uniref:ATP-binding protein n=1 Tax=Methylobacterium sp. 391_Methyba4 TaxID=3038924 RepID=UPI00241D997A|nr:ATP-binding protein [Methylobacterium sp. 391_Methyba4]WFS09714.1 ATP-binding protein [Methylobacterium sp. 391_Methyba4]
MSTPENHENIDPSAKLRNFVSPEAHKILEVLEVVKGKYITSAHDKTLMEECNRLFVQAGLRENIREPHSRTNRREGRLLVFTGPSGAGKTRSLLRTLRRHPALAGHDPEAPDSPITVVTVTSPCTLKQLGRDTLHNTGYPLERDLLEHLTWEKVRHRLDKGNKIVLVYDEMQHITQTANAAEQQKVANTIKDLMINREWRLSIIVCGLPSVAEFIHNDIQLKRRARFVEMKPLTMPDDNPDIAAMITVLAQFADLTVEGDVETDLAPRLIHAAGNLFGVAIEITHDAIETALAPDYLDLARDDDAVGGALEPSGPNTLLTRDHFARALEGRIGCTDDENPFISRDWVTTLAPKPVVEPPKKSRKRAAKASVQGSNP